MNPNIEKLIFATGALAFALVALLTVIVFGDTVARSFAVWSALFACWSQFVAQDRHPVAGKASIALAYIGFALMFVALIYFTKGG
ncbi:hypothetical protein LJR231_001553 [Phyllobacterium sp. LjRoot231]|uniref:hypothetical protein n=1 Tax=Phyllobacterium sp. LjRoot231 TaxID=3342289 RepID=UPI003ED12D90